MPQTVEEATLHLVHWHRRVSLVRDCLPLLSFFVRNLVTICQSDEGMVAERQIHEQREELNEEIWRSNCTKNP